MIGQAALAALWQFAVWGLLTAAIVMAVSLAFGHVIQFLVPAHQTQLPRSLIRSGALYVALSTATVCGLQAGIAHGALAFGDRLAAVPGGDVGLVEGLPGVPSEEPLPGRGLSDRLGTFDAAVADEVHRFVSGGILAYLVGEVVLGQFAHPVKAAVALGGKYALHARQGESSPDALVAAWAEARPDLEAAAARSSALSVLAGVLSCLGHALGAVLFLLLRWRAIRAALRGRAAYEARRQAAAAHLSRREPPP